MLAATLATEGDCTMPPKLMWPESPLCADSLHAQHALMSCLSRNPSQHYIQPSRVPHILIVIPEESQR